MHSALPQDALVLTVQAVIPATPTTRIVRLDLNARRPSPSKPARRRSSGPPSRNFAFPTRSRRRRSRPRARLARFPDQGRASGRWGHQFDAVAPGHAHRHSGTVRLVHVSRRAARAPLPVHRRRHGHRADPGDDSPGAAQGTTGPDAAALQRQDRRRLRLSARARRDGGAPDGAGGLDLRLHVTREAPDTWQGARGRITSSELAALIDDPATLCFVCGPETMVADVPRMLTELGIDRGRVRVEEW